MEDGWRSRFAFASTLSLCHFREMKSHEFSDNMSYEYDVKMIARGTKEVEREKFGGKRRSRRTFGFYKLFRSARLPATRRSLPAILSPSPLPSAHRSPVTRHPSPVTRRRSTRALVHHHPSTSTITHHPSHPSPITMAEPSP